MSSPTLTRLEKILEFRITDRILRSACIELCRNRWYPRSTLAAYAYLRGRLEDVDRVIWYGAGTHTSQLLALDHDGFLRSRIEVVIDKGAQTQAMEVAEYSVFPISEIHCRSALPIVLSHAEFESGMQRDLLSLGIPISRLVPIYSGDGYAESLELNEHDRFPEGKWQFDDRLRILRVNVRPTAIVNSDAWSLLGSRFDVLDAALCRGGTLPFKRGTLDCRQSLQMWLALVNSLQPDVIYVHDQFTTCNIVATVTKLLFPQCVVIFEPYDWLRLFFADPKLMCSEWYWSKDEFSVAMAAESECLAWYDGIVSKEEPNAVSRIAPHAISFLPYIAYKSMRHSKRRFNGGKPSLVWAGSIISSQASSVLFGDNKILPIFKRISNQEYSIQIITGHDDMEAFAKALPEYALYVESNPTARFIPGMGRTDLIDWLSQHGDYGLLLAGDASEARQYGMATTFASKLITYLAAGLPVIVSNEFEYCAALVRKWGVGIVVSQSEIDNLHSVIAHVRYEVLKFNIRIWQQQESLDRHIENLACYINECVRLADWGMHTNGFNR